MTEFNRDHKPRYSWAELHRLEREAQRATNRAFLLLAAILLIAMVGLGWVSNP